MSEKEMSEAAKAQRTSGRTLVIYALGVIVAYGVFVAVRGLSGLPWKMVAGKAILYCAMSLILMSPAFLAAAWQFLARPNLLTSIFRWFGYAWVLLQACIGMLLLSVIVMLA